MGSTPAISLVVAIMFLTARCFAGSDSCRNVKDFYKARSSDISDLISDTKSLASGTNICEGTHTCCSSEVESMLVDLGPQEIGLAVSNRSEYLAEIMSKIHREADKFFQNLIEDSKNSLHTLFSDTYGDLYKENSKVFMKFFDDLKSYYQGGVVDLTDTFEGFFTILMQKVFKLLNPSHDLHEEYMQCIGDNLNVIMPFAELPKKLSNQVRRSFIAARTFIEALKAGERVVRNMHSEGVNFRASAAGTVEFIKITHCSKCSGSVAVKPCKGVCNAALEKCLCEFGESIHGTWVKYINAMSAVLTRLEGPFNVEAVLSPLDVKISEAIMMLQENQDSITDAVTRECGELPRNPNSTFIGGISPLGGFRPSRKPLGGLDLMGFQNFNFNPADDSGSIGDDSNPLSGFNFDNFGLEGLKNLNMDGPTLDETDSGSKLSKRSIDSSQEGARKRRRRRKSRKNKKSHHQAHAVTASKRKSRNGQIIPKPDKHKSRFKNLVGEFRTEKKDFKLFWQRLPENICKVMAESTPGEDCWDGSKVIKYTTELTKSSDEKKQCVDALGIPDNMARRQAVVLQEMTSKLWHAHRGIDTTFVDHEQPIDSELSGEGSGEDDEGRPSEKVGNNGTGTRESVVAEPKPKIHKTERLIENFEDWAISLIEHALGRSVDSRSKWKDIKTSLKNHPHLQSGSVSGGESASGEKFGELSPKQQKQLKKLLELHNERTTIVEYDELSPGYGNGENDVGGHAVTETSQDTTSGAAPCSWYSITVFAVAISFNLYVLQ